MKRIALPIFILAGLTCAVLGINEYTKSAAPKTGDAAPVSAAGVSNNVTSTNKAVKSTAKSAAKSEAKKAVATQSKLVINVDFEEFESTKDLQKVLTSVAGRLWKYFPERQLKPINIVRGGPCPLVFYKRDAGGAIRVRLCSRKTYWCQYAYQFAHEFCHIMCSYDSDDNRNKWFEESICELASMFVLRKMKPHWEKNQIIKRSKKYSKYFMPYAQAIINRGRLPEGTTFKKWFAEKETQLYKDSCQRDLNRIVAVKLLPIFEKSPENWGAVEYLNKGKPAKNESFKTYLRKWKKHSPEKYRKFIEKIAAEFGYKI